MTEMAKIQQIQIFDFFGEKTAVVFCKKTGKMIEATGSYHDFNMPLLAYPDFKNLIHTKRILAGVDFINIEASKTQHGGLVFFREIELELSWAFVFANVSSTPDDTISIKSKLEQDEMTGLFNRSYGMSALHKEHTQTMRLGTVSSFMMVDIDNFKKINDQFGHAAGDHAIKMVSDCIKLGTRSTDVVSRIGGDEFLIILPNTGSNGAEIVAKKINNIVSNTPCNDGAQHEIITTVSIGIISIGCGFSGSASDILEMADKALYIAKAQGRNQFYNYEA